jgi:hypothetical protein
MTLSPSAQRGIYSGGSMQDLVNRLKSAKDLTQQLLERL